MLIQIEVGEGVPIAHHTMLHFLSGSLLQDNTHTESLTGHSTDVSITSLFAVGSVSLVLKSGVCYNKISCSSLAIVTS